MADYWTSRSGRSKGRQLVLPDYHSDITVVVSAQGLKDIGISRVQIRLIAVRSDWLSTLHNLHRFGKMEVPSKRIENGQFLVSGASRWT